MSKKPLCATHLNIVSGELSAENLQKSIDRLKEIINSPPVPIDIPVNDEPDEFRLFKLAMYDEEGVV